MIRKMMWRFHVTQVVTKSIEVLIEYLIKVIAWIIYEEPYQESLKLAEPKSYSLFGNIKILLSWKEIFWKEFFFVSKIFKCF